MFDLDERRIQFILKYALGVVLLSKPKTVNYGHRLPPPSPPPLYMFRMDNEHKENEEQKTNP